MVSFFAKTVSRRLLPFFGESKDPCLLFGFSAVFIKEK